MADVGIRDGRIVAVGTIDEAAHETIDAAGLVVCPGFVDPHTHYDAQLFWDPTPRRRTCTASPRHRRQLRLHASRRCDADDADYLRRMMAKVEGMPLPRSSRASTGTGRPSASTSTRFEGSIAVNAGFLVGHCALRRYVMGADVGRQRGHAPSRSPR